MQEEQLKHIRAKKMMLWFGIISLTMSFAGLTSAYVVSKSRADWLEDFSLPPAFYISLLLIITSSITAHFAKITIKKEAFNKGTYFLISTFCLGVLFGVFQFIGFQQIIAQGYFFTGNASSITTSFVYLIVLLHFAHIVAGLISWLVVIYNHFKKRYSNGKTLGVELAVWFWHFVDLVWIYIVLFFYFVG